MRARQDKSDGPQEYFWINAALHAIRLNPACWEKGGLAMKTTTLDKQEVFSAFFG